MLKSEIPKELPNLHLRIYKLNNMWFVKLAYIHSGTNPTTICEANK